MKGHSHIYTSGGGVLCVNCNIFIITPRRRRVLDLDTRVCTMICNWVHPVIVSEDDCVCEACWKLAAAAVNQNVSEKLSTSDGLQAGPSQRGHTKVCLLCGHSTLLQKSVPIVRENPTKLDQTIKTIIEHKVAPLEVTSSHKVCSPCWFRIQRQARHINTVDTMRVVDDTSQSIDELQENQLLENSQYNLPVIIKIENSQNDLALTTKIENSENNLALKTKIEDNQNNLALTIEIENSQNDLALTTDIENSQNDSALTTEIENSQNDLAFTTEIENSQNDSTLTTEIENSQKDLALIIDDENSQDDITMTTEMKSQLITLPDYRRAANCNRRCVFPYCCNTSLHAISDRLRAIILKKHKYYLARRTRICNNHLSNHNSWDTLYESVNSINTFSADQIQHIFSFVNTYSPSLDFNNIQEMDDRVFQYWVGLTKEHFNEILIKVPQISEMRRGSLGLAAFLLKLRTGDSNGRISQFVQVPRRTLETLMDKVREVLLQDCVLMDLGIH